MKKPILIIMAAGMGSRYGGLKQIDPIDAEGHIIMDFSIYDAIHAGFEKVIFVIKREDELDFRVAIGNRVEKYIQVEYVFQDMDYLLNGFPIPKDRKKPWGTTHAVLSCKDFIDGPFVVINADDYYGRSAYQDIYQFLSKSENSKRYAMMGYELENTLSDHGSVARGVCEINEANNLIKIIERTHIEKSDKGAAYMDEEGTLHPLSLKNLVSMNMWGFQESIMKELEEKFALFLKEEVERDPLKSECYLPNVVGMLLQEKKAIVDVLKSQDKWYGVTYKEEKKGMIEAIKSFKKAGFYPARFLEDHNG